jgi:hypothetical protein
MENRPTVTDLAVIYRDLEGRRTPDDFAAS